MAPAGRVRTSDPPLRRCRQTVRRNPCTSSQARRRGLSTRADPSGPRRTATTLLPKSPVPRFGGNRRRRFSTGTARKCRCGCRRGLSTILHGASARWAFGCRQRDRIPADRAPRWTWSSSPPVLRRESTPVTDIAANPECAADNARRVSRTRRGCTEGGGYWKPG